MKKLKLDELGRISVDAFREADKIPVSIVLDNVRSLYNVGSAFRTADAFRIQKIYLTGITGTPPHREIQKSALGATESVSWEYFERPETVVRQLQKDGYIVAAVEQTTEGTSLQNFSPDLSLRYCLVFGNEIHGVSDPVMDIVDLALEVPQAGTKHSLNISVCLGIVVWEIFRKMMLSR